MSGFPSRFETDTASTLEDPLERKHHPDFITLQRVDHELDTFRLMKISIFGMLAFVIAKLIIHLTNVAVIDSGRKTIDIILGTIELLGYLLGLQAYSTKSLLLSYIFLVFLLFSLGINVFYLIMDSEHGIWSLVAIESLQVILTLIVLAIIRRYFFLLKKRDQLKKGLRQL